MDQAPEPAAAALPPAELPGVGEIFSAATAATLDNAGLILGIWAVCALPPQVLGFLVGWSSGLGDQNAIKEAALAHNWPALGMVGAVALLGLALGMVGYAATVLLAVRALRGQPSALGDLLSDGLGRTAAVVGVSLISGVAVGFGVIFLVLPGLYLFVRLSPALCSAVVEESGPLDALARGWELTRGRFGGTLILLFAMIAVSFVALIAVIAAGIVLRLLTTAAGPAGRLFAGLAVNALQFLVSAWATACMTKYFLELTARRPSGA